MSYKNKTPSPLPKSMTLSSPSKLYTFGDLKLFPLLLAASKANEFFFFFSINEKYILFWIELGELKVIYFDNKSIIKNYNAHNKPIASIEKIKINEKEEYIITYNENEIKLWK